MTKKECEKCVHWMSNTGCGAWFCQRLEDDKENREKNKKGDTDETNT